jgi:hypothetical protein
MEYVSGDPGLLLQHHWWMEHWADGVGWRRIVAAIKAYLRMEQWTQYCIGWRYSLLVCGGARLVYRVE